jgi:UDP-glucose 4-epimerase
LTAYGADKLGSEPHCRVASPIHGCSPLGMRFIKLHRPRQQPRSLYSGVVTIFAYRVRQLPLTLLGNCCCVFRVG